MDSGRKQGAGGSKEPEVGHGASPVLSRWPGPGSAWLCFGLTTRAGGALGAAESTMQAEHPEVPGCSCFRIFLSSEISLVVLQGNREYLASFRTQTPFCSPRSVASNQESQFDIQMGLGLEYVINWRTQAGPVCLWVTWKPFSSRRKNWEVAERSPFWQLRTFGDLGRMSSRWKD